MSVPSKPVTSSGKVTVTENGPLIRFAEVLESTGAVDVVSTVRLMVVPLLVLPATSVTVSTRACAPSARSAVVRLKTPEPLAVVVTERFCASTRTTLALASVVPVTVMVLSEVMLSEGENPVSAAMVTPVGVPGAEVSTITERTTPARETLPATSVDVAENA